jgi:hypothetical protein
LTIAATTPMNRPSRSPRRNDRLSMFAKLSRRRARVGG